MAVTAAGARLTEEHRRIQVRVGRRTTRAALAAWQLIDPDNLADADDWLRALQAIAAQEARASLTAAAGYVEAFADAEGAAVPVLETFTVDQARLRGNLLITGPVRARSMISNGIDVTRAMTVAQVATAGELTRFTLEPHRETLIRATNRYARVTSGKPCAFCAMLASRGAVYRSETSGNFQAHASCGCTVEPVLTGPGTPPGRAAEFAKIWDDVGGDFNAFRRAVRT